MRALLALIAAVLITGCSTIDVAQYRNNQPQLDFFEYFMGETTGWGVVQNRKGELTRQFVVSIAGSLDADGNLVLAEDFSWSDGENSQRKWTIGRQDPHTFQGRAPDVVGVATGAVYGNVLNWNYHLNLKLEDSTWKTRFDDWMFLQPDRMLINRASMSKFGIHLGDVTIVFSKNSMI